MAVAVALTVMAALLGYSIVHTTLHRFATEADLASDRAAEWVHQVAARQHQTIVETQLALQSIAGLTSLQNLEPARCKAIIASQSERHADYLSMGVIRQDGQVQCSTRPVGITLAQGIWLFEEGQRNGLGLLPMAETGALLFGVPLQGKPATVAPAVVFAVRTLPGLDRRTPGYAGGLDIEFFTRSGLILVHQPDGENLAGKTLPGIPLIARAAALGVGNGKLAGPDGVSRFYAFVPVECPGAESCYLAAGLPEAAVNAETRRLLYTQCAALVFLLAGAAAVLAGVGGSGSGSGSVSRPFPALAKRFRWLTPVRALWAALWTANAHNAARQLLRTHLKSLGRRFDRNASRDEMAKTIESLQRAAGDMAKLNDMSHLLQTCSATDELHGVVARFAQELFSGDRGALFLISESRNLVELAIAWGDPANRNDVFMLNDCWAVRLGKIHSSETPHADPQCAHIVETPTGGYLCVPMFVRGEILGIFHLQYETRLDLPETETNDPDEDERDRDERDRAERDGQERDRRRCQLAQIFAERTALALSNLQLRESLRAQSIRDPLTGLYNRRFLNEAMEIEINRARRSRKPIGIIMIDIDHFKHFNDTFGHAAGDALLRELGEFLRLQMREEDIPCRYGGEEFIVILPGAPLGVSRERAEALRIGVGNLSFDYQGTQLGPITLSLGVACCSADSPSWQQAVKAADDALYQAKEAGRNRIGVAEPPSQ